MRSRYLWDFAELLGIDGNSLDALRFWDFISYAYGVDEYRKQELKRLEAQQASQF
jgi:hypothetical protein